MSFNDKTFDLFRLRRRVRRYKVHPTEESEQAASNLASNIYSSTRDPAVRAQVQRIIRGTYLVDILNLS